MPPAMAKLDDTYDPLTPVPAERRVFGARDAFSLWFSLGIGLLVLQAGAFLVPGLSLGMALAAIVTGSVLGALLLAAAGVVGADTGLSAMGTLRLALGARGAAVPAVLNAVQLVGWGAFEIIAMRDAADALARQTFGLSNPLAWTVLFGALATWLAFMGPVSFVRRFLRAWGLWLLLGGAGWLTWRLLSQHDLAALFAKAGTGEMSFGAGVDLVVAMPLSWLPLIADYTRFGRSPGRMFRGSAAGYLLANIWFMGLGACYALAAGSGEGLLLTALAAAGGGIALLLIVVDETDNAFADIHSAAVSTATLAPVRPARLALAFGALCTLIALLAPLARYEGFLLLIGSVFAPLFGVLLTDHFVVRRRKAEAATAFAWGLNLPGLLAWAAGVAAYQGFSRLAPQLGATLPALAVAALAYLLLGLIQRRPKA
ncbi:putative hydroxymethylpyrimidine transporter CytX [Caulobacter endophyticus]|uniref:putative hydroxymethylpyrimidine transporter CytX n=1 Tax=Caulobacter endophyticus TaxID=2172652 RepID=UPI0024105135|nr:putative hydroxymethylpyrimidine transporter CytX [Caulobacter endophyticus]MDG2529443.1 putative hydroxymethylpyrimidine transporter CytX [Caulobacter endophyticus]